MSRCTVFPGKASPKQVRSAFLFAIAATAIGLGALVLAVIGRLPAAIALMVAHAAGRRLAETQAARTGRPVRRRAGDRAKPRFRLEEGADEAQIREVFFIAAFRRRSNFDQSGSDWLAKRINAARDLLLERFGGR